MSTEQNESCPVYISPKRLARLIDKSEQSLANDRHNGRGLPYTKDGKKVLYHWPTVNQILQSQMIIPAER